MNTTLATSITTAAETSGGAWLLPLIGIVIAAVLIGAVWWGIKRRRTMRPGRTAPAESTPGTTATPPPADPGDFAGDHGRHRGPHDFPGYGNIGDGGEKRDG
ncbi:DUF6479 family protein [Streptomyces sp. NPDC001568]|uniref:DUF6479 family protein n=1 Tax=Streptomyces sp. NPDC001568 TaxID=3364588 RepID=UPI0036B7460E